MVKLSAVFLKQKMMTKVLVALIPIAAFSVWLFGWRVLLLVAVAGIVGIGCEYGIMRLINGDKAKVTQAILVTASLYALSLPPATPLWVAAVGMAFGTIFGKCVFGGFGRNIFNPALVGRCFVYVSFPAHLTINWTNPFGGFPGGLGRFFAGVDSMTRATPMILENKEGIVTDPLKLFLGHVAGSAGETSALLILIAAVWLLATKTASWQIMLSTTAAFAALSTVFWATGVSAHHPMTAVLSGGFLFAAVFMATDPVSAPVQVSAKVIYGILIAFLAVIIRSFSLFTEGIMFAILIANVFVPLIDRQVRSLKARREAVGKQAAT